MPQLPSSPDFQQLRRQAKELLARARAGDQPAIARIAAVSSDLTLAAAQLSLAREYGFSSWATMRIEVERREILDDRDLARLTKMIAADPGLATGEMEHWCDHPLGANPLGYVAMLRYDTTRNQWRDVTGTAALARELLAAGAPVDGIPEDGGWETPLMTAASYGDAAVARVLVEAGARLELTAGPESGGVPNGTALLHAAVFGMTDVVDVLVEAGAVVPDAVQAAATGSLSQAPEDAPTRLRALMMAAHHQRLPVLEMLVAAGTPVDQVEPVWGRQALRLAAEEGRPAAVAKLLELGADPDLRDADGRSALDLCRRNRRNFADTAGHDEVETLLTGSQ